MIHLTVATPLGIDSLFFSFVQRLAVQNGHVCVDPPAENLDGEQPSHWIEAMCRSSQHHFVIGYRYPPRYWKEIAEQASTVAVLVDGDGIARQVERIHLQEGEGGAKKDLSECVQQISHAVAAMGEMTEWLLSDASPTRLLPPGVAFQVDAEKAFRRVERFYQEANVPISSSCWKEFSREARPLLDQIQPASPRVLDEIHRVLILEDSSPSRLEALGVLFGHEE